MNVPARVKSPLLALETFWRKSETARLIKVVAVAALVYLIIFALFPLFHGYTSPLDFAHIGQHFCCNPTSKSYGYDGQFYYYIATDPLHASIHMDFAPYRYQRIFYPMAVWALSLGGNASLAAWWLLLLNVLGALAGTAALAVLLQRRGLSPWFSLIFAFYFGQLAAMTHDVPDSLAATFIVFAALAADREQWKTCAFWLAIAGLTRETTLVFAAGAAVNALFEKRPWRAALLLSAALPLILWLDRPAPDLRRNRPVLFRRRQPDAQDSLCRVRHYPHRLATFPHHPGRTRHSRAGSARVDYPRGGEGRLAGRAGVVGGPAGERGAGHLSQRLHV